MASTSTSSVPKRFKYDVFLSFRGEDTRKTFVDHLYHALHQRGIIIYKDDEKIKKGERISEQLIRSIEESQFHIIVFSKNYASSSWCLDELVKIMECQRTTEQTAYPVFYDVEPTEVRNQSGAVGEAFEKHVEKQSAGKWRDALKEAAGLAGWELKNTLDGHEAKFIQKIVIDMSLKPQFISSSIYDEKLVGMEVRVRKVVSSLEIGLEDVRMIGIKGIGGGGKTTLAIAVFDHISLWFEGTSFVENVREVSKSSLSGLKELQKEVLSDVLNDQNIVVKSVPDGKKKMKKMIGSRKVLVVLDDVDDIDQLEALAGQFTWFKPGSRIIITTRDEQVLVAHGMNFIHDVSLLSDEEAICLFSRYAFRREIPDEAYAELSRKVVRYADGLPLTIKVLGSHLCGKSESEWGDAIERLKVIPLEKTLKRLEISYDGLKNDEKEIFLDVVCILKGEEKEEAVRRLESCGFNAEIGLRVLEQKSLITISTPGFLKRLEISCDCLGMHDHIEEMGWNIVRRLHPDEPNKHSRLWIKEEIEDILVNELGTEATRSIKLMYTNLHPSVIMKGLRNMRKLRFLYVVNNESREWEVDELSQFLPDALRYICWGEYPLRTLPKTFRANKLVNLEMIRSNITELWGGGEREVLNKLRFLNLSFSRLRTFDLGMTPHLEDLNLERSVEFVELHLPIECPNLRYLKLMKTKVTNLNIGMAPHLEDLNLEGCEELVELHLPVKCPNLKSLDLSGSKVGNLNIGMTPHLEDLNLKGCKEFVELHLLVKCPNLKSLDLSGSKVGNLNIGMTPHLEDLNLKGCKEFVELHLPVECSNLKYLDLSGSKVTNLNIGMTPHLERLDLQGCNEFVELHLPVECPNLKYLNLRGSKVTNFNLGMTPHLKDFNLEGCKKFVELHFSVECRNLKYGSKVTNLNLGMTPHLEDLNLKGCKEFVEFHLPVECPNLKYLSLSGSKVTNLNIGMTPHLERLDLEGCNEFVELHLPVECPNLKYLDLRGSKVTNLNIGMTPHLEILDLEGCNEFVELHLPIECPNLRYLDLSGSKVTNLNIGMTPHLDRLYLGGCKEFVRGSKVTNLNIEMNSHLERLDIEGLKEFIDLHFPVVCPNLNLSGSYLNLEELTLSMKEIEHLPDSICLLKNLKYLDLKSCWLLEQLPKDIGRLECLEKLILTECVQLRDIPESICRMKSLIHLDLCYCILVEKLPEELGQLQNLLELDIEGAGISHIPRSVFQLKSLCIYGSRWRLESYGFRSLRNISRYRASCNIGEESHHESPQ